MLRRGCFRYHQRAFNYHFFNGVSDRSVDRKPISCPWEPQAWVVQRIKCHQSHSFSVLQSPKADLEEEGNQTVFITGQISRLNRDSVLASKILVYTRHELAETLIEGKLTHHLIIKHGRYTQPQSLLHQPLRIRILKSARNHHRRISQRKANSTHNLHSQSSSIVHGDVAV